MLEVMQLAADQDPQQAEPADTPTDDKAIIFEQVRLSMCPDLVAVPVVVGSAAAQLHFLKRPSVLATQWWAGLCRHAIPVSSFSWQCEIGAR